MRVRGRYASWDEQRHWQRQTSSLQREYPLPKPPSSSAPAEVVNTKVRKFYDCKVETYVVDPGSPKLCAACFEDFEHVVHVRCVTLVGCAWILGRLKTI